MMSALKIASRSRRSRSTAFPVETWAGAEAGDCAGDGGTAYRAAHAVASAAWTASSATLATLE
jgi:hypothetical protein